MIFWNRIEIYNGCSLKEFTELKDALAQKGIRYEYRYKSTAKNKKAKRYYLYIHQKDYDKAMYLTSNRK